MVRVKVGGNVFFLLWDLMMGMERFGGSILLVNEVVWEVNDGMRFKESMS